MSSQVREEAMQFKVNKGSFCRNDFLESDDDENSQASEEPSPPGQEASGMSSFGSSDKRNVFSFKQNLRPGLELQPPAEHSAQLNGDQDEPENVDDSYDIAQAKQAGKKHPLTSKAPTKKVDLFTTPVFKEHNSPRDSIGPKGFLIGTPAANLPKSSPKKELVSGLNTTRSRQSLFQRGKVVIQTGFSKEREHRPHTASQRLLP